MTKGSVDTILKELHQTEYGEHVIVIHPHIATLSKTYSHYAKAQLVNNNEIVLLLPYYEATGTYQRAMVVVVIVVLIYRSMRKKVLL